MLNHFSTDHPRRTVAILLPAIVLAALIWTGCGSDQVADETATSADIQTTRVELVTIPDHYEALGSIRSTTRSTVASKLMGTVVSVFVDVGDTVREGQPLLELDTREVDAQIRKAEAGISEIDQAIQGAEAGLSAADANLELARATFGRYEALRERQSVSPQEFEEVEARFKSARAEHERVLRQLEGVRSRRQQALADLSTARTYGTWARVTSPLDGVVTARHVDAGDLATPGMPLVAIDDPGSYRLDVQVDESRLSMIRIGDPVKIQVDAIGIATDGMVEAIAPAVDPATRSALVRIDLPDSAPLQSGMFARAYFTVGERKAIMVPTSLITRRGQLEGVYIVDDSGEPRFRLIRTGSSIGTETEVLSGLDEGDRVVTEDVTEEPEGSTVALKQTSGATS